MFGEKRGSESKLHRIYVSCKTCGISEAFYSNLSVANFKLKHAGHDVDDGSGHGAPPQEGREAKPVPVVQKVQSTKKGTKLFKVVVDLMDFPAFPNPVFRVRGIKDDLSTAFILTSPFEESSRVKETLASGQYVDYGYSEALYLWEPDAVEYEGQARERLGMPGEAARRFRNPEPMAPKQAPLQNSDPNTVAKTNEILFDVHRASERGPANGEEQRVAPPVVPATADPYERRVPPSVRRPAVPERTEVPAPRTQVPPRPERAPAPEAFEVPDHTAQIPDVPERRPVAQTPGRVLAPMPDLTEAPAPRPQISVRTEKKTVEEAPDRVLASLPDLNEAPAPRVEAPTRPVRPPVEEGTEGVLSSLPELIEAPAPRVQAPARPERPPTPTREPIDVPVRRPQVPARPESAPAPEAFAPPTPREQAPRPERRLVEDTPQRAPAPAPVPARVEPKPHPMQFPAKPEQKAVDSRPKDVPAASADAKGDETLLVSKSWYIQGGSANRKEAVRISKVLKEFRWKVEPMFTIGVMLDDIVSIESTNNQVNRKVIKGVEDIGYRLTAVTADQGKVIAWFKKKEGTAKS